MPWAKSNFATPKSREMTDAALSPEIHCRTVSGIRHWVSTPSGDSCRRQFFLIINAFSALGVFYTEMRRGVWDSFLLLMSPADGHYALVTPMVPSVRRSTVGDRAFTVAGPRVSNTLPEEITTSQTLYTFSQQLKTWLFRKSYPDIIIWTFFIQIINLEVTLLYRQSLIDWLIDCRCVLQIQFDIWHWTLLFCPSWLPPPGGGPLIRPHSLRRWKLYLYAYPSQTQTV